MSPNRRVLCLWAALAALAPARPAGAAPPRTAVVASYTLRVGAAADAARLLVDFTERHGGYFASWTDDALELRVPIGQVNALNETLGAAGTIVDRRWDSDDVGDELAQLDAKLASRRAMLARYRAVLETATPEAVVAVERQMIDLISRIETTQGELDVLRHRVGFARVTVSLRAVDTAPPPDVGASSFPWMNSLDLSRFEGSFRDEH